jgi:hypothetical protein
MIKSIATIIKNFFLTNFREFPPTSSKKERDTRRRNRKKRKSTAGGGSGAGEVGRGDKIREEKEKPHENGKKRK